MSVNYNNSVVLTDIAVYIDITNPKCYSPNVHPYPTDLYSWVQTGPNCTLSRDTTTQSPVGNTPLKMVQNANDPYTSTYNSPTRNLCPAVIGETWTASVWVKASEATTIQGPEVFEANSSGSYLTGSFSSNEITTDWKRISITRTLNNASTAFVQCRMEGTHTGGAGITVWWDGLQIERTSSASNFNPIPNVNGLKMINPLTSTNHLFTTNINLPIYNKTYFEFDGVDDYVHLGDTSYPTSSTDPFSCEILVRVPSAATWSNGVNDGSLFTRGTYAGSIGFIRAVTNNQIGFWIRGNTSGLGYVAATLVRDKWEHYIGTWDGYAMTIYKNGVLASTANQLTTGGFEANVWWLGSIQAMSGANGNRFQGDIGLAKVYKKCLTPAEVYKNFIAVKGRVD